MGEFEFINDLCCNYLTIPYEGREEDFALRMMTENITDVFSDMELRRLDGRVFLYYKISGMQSMEILYAEKPMDRSAFQTFMWHLQEAIEQSRELFLPGNGICLEPSVLFWSLDEEHWKFIYVPGTNGRETAEIQREKEKLAEFLVMHIDNADRDLSETVYRFYEEIYAGKVFSPKICSAFEEEKIASERDDMWEREGKTEEEEEKGTQAESWDYEVHEKGEQERESNAEYGNSSKKAAMIVCGLFCVAAGVTLAAGRLVPEMMPAGMAVTVMLTICLIIILMKRKVKVKNEACEAEDIIYTEPEEWLNNPESKKGEEYEGKKGTTEEKTVYMDIGREQERKLYGIGKFRQQRIFLDTLPCLVGKDKALVNHIITDASVSRMHARFFAEKETVWMQDLNSTNGTYHNGMRLSPNERVILEAEDEIGFGQAQFVFR